jgi:hypothetical protein
MVHCTDKQQQQQQQQRQSPFVMKNGCQHRKIDYATSSC